MHFKPKTLLIEAGAQTNTVEEMRNAMEILAELLSSGVVLIQKYFMIRYSKYGKICMILMNNI